MRLTKSLKFNYNTILRAFGIVILTLIHASNISAQENLPFEPVKTSIPPVIDGNLNDEIWQKSTGLTGFKTFIPDYGKPHEEKTVVYISYDSENIYFAFKCYDSEPDKIKTSFSPRDKIRPDDWICINLDSNNDDQSLIALYTNPSGIQMDARWDGQKEDHGVDIIFESAALIDNEGYNVEFKIPYKSLRYSRQDIVQMGVIFERKISRYSSQATYPSLDPEMAMNFLLANMKINFRDIKHYTLFEVLPAITYSNLKTAQNGELAVDVNEPEISATAKLGISSDLILDVTYNPDFSQVESDAGQVEENQRYALYYPEKRPFFLEGNEHYGFAGSGGFDPFRSIVHTRQIVNPELGIKLSGKIGQQNHLAALYASDKLPDPDSEGQKQYARFTILRYKHSLKDDSYLGWFFTGREVLNGHNRVLGTDGKIRLGKSSIIGYHGATSITTDSMAQNPDHETAFGLSYDRNTRNSTVNISLQEISEGFETRTGYITRTGISRGRLMYSPHFFPKRGFIKSISPLITGNISKDKPSDLYEYMAGQGLSFVLPRSTNVTAVYSWSTEIFLNQKFEASGLYLRASSQIFRDLFISMNYLQGKRIRYIENPYQGYGNTINISANYQPTDHFNTYLSYIYTDFYKDSNNEKVFDYSIIRSKNTYQINKYLFLRAIIEYNTYNRDLITDFLASFTYIPGTVVHIGYGSMYERRIWNDQQYIEGKNLLETKRGFFFKASYLWRL